MDNQGLKFTKTQLGHPKLVDPQGYTYVKRRDRKENGKVVIEYWSCTSRQEPRCGATFHFIPASGEWRKMTQPHSCDHHPIRVVKRAYERLKELTLAAEEGTRPVDIVNKMLEEVPPQTWEAFPAEKALKERVRKYAKAGGVALGPNTYSVDEDDGGEEDDGGGGSGGGVVKNKAILEFRLRTGNRKLKQTLSLVDEEGRDLSVPVDMIVTAGEEQPEAVLDFDSLPRGGASMSMSTPADHDEETAHMDSNDFMNDGDDMDVDDNAQDKDPLSSNLDYDEGTVMKSSRMKKSTVTTSSKVKSGYKRRLKEAVKSGEKCFVCGDHILVSEASSSSQETFRKACCYLNVRSEHEWFPRKSNGQFYSFCELCTNEITRIQQLYKNVEEKQSLIFKKVAQLEKLIADSEILDNSLVEGPVSSAKRLEGFRKQVINNYKNKLKLRREMRMGTKLGHDLIEIQPIPSAHMFASDPAETPTTPENSTPTAKKRGRGRPKKSEKTNAPSEREQVVEETPDPIHHSATRDDDVPGSEVSGDGDFHAFDDDAPRMADDDDDAMSVASEKERKFWEDDPTQLKLPNGHSVANEDEVNNDGGDNVEESGDDYEDDGMADDDQSDSDYDVDNDHDDDDDDWEKSKSGKGTNNAPPKKRGRPSTSSSRINQEKSAKLTKRSRPTPTPKSKQSPKPMPKPPPKPKKKTHRANIVYPDVVLTKEGRMFLSDIELIKNPPGMYKPRPSELSFSCGSCGKISRDFTSAKTHVAAHHLNWYVCDLCGKKLSDARHLQTHKENKHSTTPRAGTPCPVCGKPIKTEPDQKAMRLHIWHHLSSEEKKDPKYVNYAPYHKRDPNRKKKTAGLSELQCQHCPKRYFRMDALQAHEKTHTDPDDGAANPGFQCQFCGKLYKQKDSLQRHNQRCGNSNPGPPTVESQLRYPCPVCEVSLKSPILRRGHMRKFHGSGSTSLSSSSQPFGCPKCPRRFQTRKAFQSHKRICVEGPSKMGAGNSPPQQSPQSGDAHQDQTSANSSDDESNPANGSGNPIQISSSSAELPPVGFSYNLFGNYDPPSGNPFHSHHHQQ